MDQVRRGLVFWVLLLVSVVLTASDTVVKKVAYQAKITVLNEATGNRTGVGGAFLWVRPDGTDYMVQTHAYPDLSVTKVLLTPEQGSGYGEWQVILCEQGGPTGDCQHDAEGNLDIDGAIVGLMLSAAGTDAPTFFGALRAGKLTVTLNDGSKGTGTFVRIGS
jgi:hypothetical protein